MLRAAVGHCLTLHAADKELWLSDARVIRERQLEASLVGGEDRRSVVCGEAIRGPA
jgi:hypothetical protein